MCASCPWFKDCRGCSLSSLSRVANTSLQHHFLTVAREYERTSTSNTSICGCVKGEALCVCDKAANSGRDDTHNSDDETVIDLGALGRLASSSSSSSLSVAPATIAIEFDAEFVSSYFDPLQEVVEEKGEDDENETSFPRRNGQESKVGWTLFSCIRVCVFILRVCEYVCVRASICMFISIADCGDSH